MLLQNVCKALLDLRGPLVVEEAFHPIDIFLYLGEQRTVAKLL